MRTKCLSESQSQTRLSVNEHPQRRPQTRSHIVTKTFSDSQKHEQSAVQVPVYALINVLYTQKLLQRIMAAPTFRRTAILLIVTFFVCLHL